MDIYLVKACTLKAKLIKLAGPYQLICLTLHILYDPSIFVQNDTLWDIICSVLVKLWIYWLPYTPFLNPPSCFKWIFLYQSP